MKAHLHTEVWSTLGTNVGERTLPAVEIVVGKLGEVFHATAHRLPVLGGLSPGLTLKRARAAPLRQGTRAFLVWVLGITGP